MILKLTRRVTTPFLQSIPTEIEHFNAYMYAVVQRKPGKDFPDHEWGVGARIDPCILDFDHLSIEMSLPSKINYGIESFDDLDPRFFEAIEAAFISMMHGVLN